MSDKMAIERQCCSKNLIPLSIEIPLVPSLVCHFVRYIFKADSKSGSVAETMVLP